MLTLKGPKVMTALLLIDTGVVAVAVLNTTCTLEYPLSWHSAN